jgi:hypothetical protein
VHDVLRLILGCLLLTAAAFKAHGLAIDPVPQDSYLASPRIIVASIELEIIVGGWLLSGWSSRAARTVAIGFFAILGVTSLYLALEGQSSCGCFGSVSISPWVSLTVNGAAILGLLVFRPPVLVIDESDTGFKATFGMLAGALAFLALIAGAFLLISDDPRATLARLRGEPLTIEPIQTWLGDGNSDEQRAFTIHVSNRGNQPVQIVGGTASCGCNPTADVPILIPAGESRPLSVTVFFRGQPGRFQGFFILFTDDKGQPTLQGRFSGRVRKSP